MACKRMTIGYCFRNYSVKRMTMGESKDKKERLKIKEEVVMSEIQRSYS
jgi:hypothetical protein